MLYKNLFWILVALAAFFCPLNYLMAEQPLTQPGNPERASITLKELADIYWPGSGATEVQKEQTIQALLGKQATFEVTVAQIQRKDRLYLIQGQSSKDELGTFSYIEPSNPQEENLLNEAERGSKLTITGIVDGLDLRHLVLKPAHLSISK